MITSVSCSACGRAQNAPSSRAGQEVACRFCGDSILVPGSASPQSAIGGWRNVEPAPTPQDSAPAPRDGAELERSGPSAQPLQGAEPPSTEWGQTPSAPDPHEEHALAGGLTARSEWEREGSESGPPPDFAGAPVFDRAQQRPADAGRQPKGAPVGAPLTTSRHAREAKAGRPIVSDPSSAKPGSPFDLFLPGLNSDSQTEKSASIAMVLAIAGWAFCFPISLGAIYFADKSKKHALAEGLAVPQLATIANVVAILNLGFVSLVSFGNLS